ncbi:MAG: hypothetical protein JRE23_14975 [Deltaproteobacteria bacterium]|nr:hypothetical protein [Deltaproteobacteria bacterium]
MIDSLMVQIGKAISAITPHDIMMGMLALAGLCFAALFVIDAIQRIRGELDN